MLGFFTTVAVLLLDPVVLVSGIVIGYLFYADMQKLAWGLLLCVCPALPTVWHVASQGSFLDSLAQLASMAILAVLSNRALNIARHAPRRPGERKSGT